MTGLERRNRHRTRRPIYGSRPRTGHPRSEWRLLMAPNPRAWEPVSEDQRHPAFTTARRGAVQAIAAEEPATDSRLQQKVYVHATMQRLGDLLSWLTKATGVSLVARLEVADEKVSLWAEDRPLMDVMRDIRHLRGYYW